MPTVLTPGELLLDWETADNGRKIPAKITVKDFRRYFLANFPKLANTEYDQLIEDAIDIVYDMFSGVSTIWDIHPEGTWYAKTQTCYRLLIAWYIADQYPSFVAGISVMGGIPLQRKKIDGVDLTFKHGDASKNEHYEDLLEALKSNPWGFKARLMIKAAAKRAMLRNRRVV